MVSTAKVLAQAAGRTIKLGARRTGVEASSTHISLKPLDSRPGNTENQKLVFFTQTGILKPLTFVRPLCTKVEGQKVSPSGRQKIWSINRPRSVHVEVRNVV